MPSISFKCNNFCYFLTYPIGIWSLKQMASEFFKNSKQNPIKINLNLSAQMKSNLFFFSDYDPSYGCVSSADNLSSDKSNKNSHGQSYEIGPTIYYIWSHFTNFYWSTFLLLVCGSSSQVNH